MTGLQTWPGISRHFEQHEACSALSFQVTSFPYVFLLSCLVQFTAITPASVFLIYRCFTALKTRKRLMSTRTYRMHRQLLVTLVCQLLVPLVTLILPNTLNACFTLFEIRRFSALPLVLFLLATLHSPLNAVMMLSLIGPYRRFLLSLLWRMRQQASTQEAQSGPSMAIHSRTRVADVGSRKF